MRFIISCALLLVSFSSMAWVDMAITSGDYLIWVRLIGDHDGVVQGAVMAENSQGNICNGRYTLDIANGLLTLQFGKQKSSVMDDECMKESMHVRIGVTGFSYLIDGHSIDGDMQSAQFETMQQARLQPIQLF